MERIRCTDIPEKTDWSKAVVGKFYRPIKKRRLSENVPIKKLEGQQVTDVPEGKPVCV